MKIARSRPSTWALLVVPVVAACTALANGDPRQGKETLAHVTETAPARAEIIHARAYSDRYDARPRAIAR